MDDTSRMFELRGVTTTPQVPSNATPSGLERNIILETGNTYNESPISAVDTISAIRIT